MTHETKVSQVMTGEVVVAKTTNTIKQVQDLFIRYDMHHLPVVENDKVLGIISQTDLLNCYDSLLEKDNGINNESLNSTLTVDVMTAKPVSVAPVTTLRTAAEMMDEHHCHSLPVIEHGKIIGILTSRDVVKYVGDQND